MRRRILTTSAILLGLVCVVPTLAGAQGWTPTRPIKMICPFPAGGGTDQIARIVAKGLTDRLGQQVYVENRGGANGGLGAQEVMRAEPDGYTIGAISDSPMTVNPWMYEKLPYSPPKVTVHGDLRTITAAKQSDRTEAGQPKTFNSGMP